MVHEVQIVWSLGPESKISNLGLLVPDSLPALPTQGVCRGALLRWPLLPTHRLSRQGQHTHTKQASDFLPSLLQNQAKEVAKCGSAYL